MLLTIRNWCVSLAGLASSSGKYFWFAFIVRIRHSCGTARNSGSNWHDEHVGPLDQRGDLVEQRGVVDRRQPLLRGSGLQLARDLGAARVEARDHRAFGFDQCCAA